MEVPEFFPPPENLTAAVVHPLCEEWKGGSEVAIFHLASIFLVLGFMGGSGFYGLLYLFTFLTLGFFCTTIWSWSDACTTDTFLWNFALFGVCAVQVVHVAYRLRNVTFEKEFQDLYSYLFKKLGVSLTHFGKIVACCEGDIHTIEKDHCFAMEGKTAIDKLSVLLSGRIRVTVNGEFLHYIYPFQFLDSPEWDSLRPSEEGLFQVTLRADNCCRYVSWRRKKLYLLFAKHRYIAKVFALVVRNDIADKLYSLNDKAFDSRGFRYDLRLPTYCHVPPLPELDRTDAFLRVPAQCDHGHRARVPITITAPKETVS
ncbi:popeye domain-containing protein 3-like [Salvelinus fontinalis]|uniref:popeye domain-containing protein 3-like n=1 Tax=Salvelinus fontinalis TaxID=8038 RepID=UPI002485D346|nr:popeye domain-containing protein 3-like [Salvelinus fontinalis]